mmetsp:Transcript_31109/g.99833  ORF Transcript_31109/g.99833 Transcript_31109/m.99833 type:complete len:329 (+) Transcript_31109:111-1097(+)
MLGPCSWSDVKSVQREFCNKDHHKLFACWVDLKSCGGFCKPFERKICKLSGPNTRTRGGKPSCMSAKDPGSTHANLWLRPTSYIPPVLFLMLVYTILSSPSSPQFLVVFALSSSAAMMAELLTFPCDAIKARTQLGPSDRNAHPPPGMMDTFSSIPTLYFGIRAGLLRTLPYSGLRMVLYRTIRDLAQATASESLSLLALAGLAMLSGAVAQFIVSPLDLFKIRMQADGRRVKMGLKPVYHGLWDIMTSVPKQEGFKKLWAGSTPNVIRACCVNIGDQAVYDVAKRTSNELVIKCRCSQDVCTVRVFVWPPSIRLLHSFYSNWRDDGC